MLVSLKQLKRAREEIEEKYRAENKLYVDKAAFDNEYSIFRELCEKTFTMVSDTISNLFPSTLVFTPTKCVKGVLTRHTKRLVNTLASYLKNGIINLWK